MLAPPPGELAPPPRGNPRSATVIDEAGLRGLDPALSVSVSDSSFLVFLPFLCRLPGMFFLTPVLLQMSKVSLFMRPISFLMTLV